MNEERRRKLGIPVHSDDEHEWRRDGYCNCGASRKLRGRVRGATDRADGKRGHVDLDVIEGNDYNR